MPRKGGRPGCCDPDQGESVIDDEAIGRVVLNTWYMRIDNCVNRN